MIELEPMLAGDKERDNGVVRRPEKAEKRGDGAQSKVQMVTDRERGGKVMEAGSVERRQTR